jgi:hypothetical protein
MSNDLDILHGMDIAEKERRTTSMVYPPYAFRESLDFPPGKRISGWGKDAA